MKWNRAILGLLVAGTVLGARAENLLRNADFQQPRVVYEGRERPYAVPDEWTVEGLVRMGHPLQTPPGRDPQIVALIDGGVSQLIEGRIEPDTFYTVQLRLRHDGWLQTVHFEAALVAVDDAGGEMELMRFGARDDGTSFGHAVPLQSGEWQEQIALWNSGLHPERVGERLLLRIAGRRIELAEATLTSEPGPLPGNSPAWFRRRIELHGDAHIGAVTFYSYFYGYNSGVYRPVTGADRELAYNYSAFLMKDVEAGIYRLWNGARWRDESKGWDGDHIIQHVSRTGEGFTWQMPHDPPRPETTQGRFEGEGPDYALEQWWTGNYMDPEVVKVDGTYYLYTQVQINPGNILDPKTGLRAEAAADRVQLHTSEDGLNWTRWSRERGVIIHIDQPERTLITHHESLYVPWDRETPWWMYINTFQNYVRGSHDNVSQFYLLRSNDPTTYDWRQRVAAVNMQHLGNQTGYFKQAPGGPLFFRMTHKWFRNLERQMLVMQHSRDGVQWNFFGNPEYPLMLDSSKNEALNKNCYFPGFSTLDGTGEIAYLGNGWYRMIYGAATANGGGQPHIWHSEIGTGILYVHIEEAR